MDVLHFPSQVAADRYALEQRIAALQSHPSPPISQSTDARHTLKLQLDALNAPIYKLSDELLADIFLVGLDQYLEEDRFDLVRLWQYRATLCSTVSRFRRVAMSVARMWAIVKVETFTSPSDPTSRWAYAAGEGPDICRKDTLLDLFVELTVNMPDIFVGDVLPVLCRRSKRARIYGYQHWSGYRTYAGFTLVPIATSLSELALGLLQLPALSDLQNLLMSTPALRRLVLRFISFSNTDANGPTVALPLIESVEITTDIWNILEHIDISSCQTLHLQGRQTCYCCTHDDDDEDGAISPQIPPMYIQAVRRLTITTWCPSEAMLIKTICAFPSLLNLTLHDIKISLNSGNPVGVCPPLEDVTIYLTEESSGLLSFILESRAGGTLRRLDLDIYSEISDELSDTLQERVPVLVRSA